MSSRMVPKGPLQAFPYRPVIPVYMGNKPRRRMPGKGARHQMPLVLQLVKNREEQQENSEGRRHCLAFFTRQSMEGIDLEPVMEWVRVCLSVFWLSLLSGSFLCVWVFVLKLAGF